MPFDHTIEILTVVGSWIAGLGSIVAAIVALRLARRAEKVRLVANAGLSITIGENQLKEELLEIGVTSIGERPITITGVGWRIGKPKKKSIRIPEFSHTSSDQCPRKA